MSKTNALLTGVIAVLLLTVVIGGGAGNSGTNQQAAGTTADLQTYGTVGSLNQEACPAGTVYRECATTGWGCYTNTTGCTLANTSTVNTGGTLQTPPASLFSKSLSYGMTNDIEVKKLQTALRLAGTFNFLGAPTGNFGSVTLKALNDFKIQKGLVADGKVDALTQKMLLGSAQNQCGDVSGTTPLEKNTCCDSTRCFVCSSSQCWDYNKGTKTYCMDGVAGTW